MVLAAVRPVCGRDGFWTNRTYQKVCRTLSFFFRNEQYESDRVVRAFALERVREKEGMAHIAGFVVDTEREGEIYEEHCWDFSWK
jgi:hypothetical protein